MKIFSGSTAAVPNLAKYLMDSYTRPLLRCGCRKKGAPWHKEVGKRLSGRNVNERR